MSLPISTFDAVSLAVGICGIIFPLIFTLARYKIDFPELPFLRYGLFRGFKTKREVKSIVILRNGSADYAKQIRSGFMNRASEVFARTEYAIQMSDYEGHPYSEQDLDNKKLIGLLLNKRPDVLVTIGTQVSLSAVKHFNNQVPIIAIGLGAPIQCGLTDPADGCSTESGNFASVRYGLKLEARLMFMTSLFQTSKRALNFYFLWNDRAPQDRLLAEEVARIAESGKLGIKLELVKTAEVRLPEDLDEHGNVFFGFYHLNKHLETFLGSARKAVFMGLNPNDTRFGCIASTGNNDYRLGELAVDHILVPHLINRAYLCNIPLVEPDAYFTINREVAEQKNFRFSRKGRKRASEIVDFNRAAWLQIRGENPQTGGEPELPGEGTVAVEQ